ncbi:MAG: nitrous oxide reductase family maturation protein NosD [Gammaproteobacteria bacterium]|nr:nitrous oxide reductase family maturation protein NosD [Gammaproteobacteria bacterium]
MRRFVRRISVVSCFLVFVFPHLANAGSIRVAPGEGSLQAAIDKLETGGTLVLRKGVYSGALIIDKPLTLKGAENSIVDGGGQGRVITVDAANVTIDGITVKNSGVSLASEDSGIFATELAANVIIENNRFEDNLIGIYLKGAPRARVRNNIIYGSRDPHMNDRGNGVHIWNATNALVENNKLYYGRDGIFVTTSKGNTYRNNYFEYMRFAIHYMYTHDSEVSANLSVGNHSAYALMFSDRLKVFDNVASGARDRGLFLNSVNYSELRNNSVHGGSEKCVFIYNANSNQFQENYFEGCDIGIHFTAGSENNVITRNSFIGNRTQVKYVGTRYIEWSADGRGNYWSDNPAFDLNRDGIADRVYHPNDLVDQIVWRYPMAKLLLNSPTTQLLRWAQSEFPSLHPGGVTDSAALMAPVVTRSENYE